MNEDPPPEIMGRAIARLAIDQLVKAVKPFRGGKYSLDKIQPALGVTVARLYAKHRFGEILSAYFSVGVFGSLQVKDLIRELYARRDYPGFIKQVYRFDALNDFSDEVQVALEWHRSRKLPDAAAWDHKFKKLAEQRALANAESISVSDIKVLDEETVDLPVIPSRTFTLRPLRNTCSEAKSPPTDVNQSDPYIVSRTARCKVERATREHERTLTVLCGYLAENGVATAANQLIDAFAELPSGPAIFEVKSINSDNERDQVRHAISQLYEYRFLHNITKATLWIVFSQMPDSGWLLDYLVKDRDIKVLWVQENQLCGHSLGHLFDRL